MSTGLFLCTLALQSLFLLPSLHAFVKSLMTLGAAAHVCSLASYQEGLLQLVHI